MAELRGPWNDLASIGGSPTCEERDGDDKVSRPAGSLKDPNAITHPGPEGKYPV